MKLTKTTRAIIGLSLVVLVGFGTTSANGAPKGGGSGKPTTVSHTARQVRPIQLGVSGGSVTDTANGYCCSGTLGALVQDAGGTQYILSNTHVFAGDSALGGNGATAQVGDAINQPGYVDVNCQDITADTVAELTTWVPLTPDGNSVADAALALVVPGMVDPSGRILEIGTISATPAVAFINQAVKKSGRTSGLTTGKVAGLDATVSVRYSDECGGQDYVTSFTGQIIVTPGKFLKSGDSGSLMVENKASNPRPVGLLFAGSSTVAIANPIDDVLDALGVSMVGVSAGATGAQESTSLSNMAPGLAKASQAKAKHAARLMGVPGAVGHAVGLGNGPGGKPVVKLLVERATPEAQAAAPTAIDGVPVEIWEVGTIEAY